MAGFLPFISEILPMIMPAATHVATAKDIEADQPNVRGPVTRREAITGKCDKMCAADANTKLSKVLTARPQSCSQIRHNSEQDTIIYAVSGDAVLIVKEGFEDSLKRNPLSPGSFAFVPAWTEHQMKNESDKEAVWVMIQSGSNPVGAVLTDWGGEEVGASEDE
ncbi:hypothetical protein Golomagni_06029 [Golovinomyces magnicellulatus]|nr:hypothetical protein Golomagni_06029 [Golovinomyces magnicellulatus]